jgi:beta-glucosidase
MVREAVETASEADVIVAAIGEAQEMTGEAASRADIGIPPDQRPLLEALKKTGKPLVLVIFAGRPLTLTWENDNADAMLMAWFGGTEAGNGIADVLFGGVNPAGKLTATFPRHVGQVPIYYNHKNTGRPYLAAGGFEDKFKSRYLDVANDPLFSFGHGLSYTTFSYSAVKLDKAEVQGEGPLTATVTVTNTGKFAGDEVVQLYISDPVASISRSVKDLRGFKKISLKPGEKRDVSFTITTEELKFYDSALEHVWEPGEFIIHIGTSSAQVQSAKVDWKK